MKKYLIISVLVTLSLFFALNNAFAIDIGHKAPIFHVSSGDGRAATLDSIRGKVAVIFYETTDVIERNRSLKEDLKAFYNAQGNSVRENIIRLPIINCTSAGSFVNMWKKSLIDNSSKEGLTIYGDWDGAMFSVYGMINNDSNFLIIDKGGTVRYISVGRIPDVYFQRIKDLLIKLIEE